MSENRYIYARDNPLSLIDPSGHMFTTVALNYYSTLSAKNSYTNSPAYQSWVLTETTSALDCGGTGCVASNYVPVVRGGSYSTALGGTSVSGPTVDQAAYQSSPFTTTVTTAVPATLSQQISAGLAGAILVTIGYYAAGAIGDFC